MPINTDEVIDVNGPPSSGPQPTMGQATPMPIPGKSVPSIIAIPNQFATTLCWVAVGFAIGYYLCHKTTGRSR